MERNAYIEINNYTAKLIIFIWKKIPININIDLKEKNIIEG